MTLFFTALLVIAIVGLCILFLSKHFEARTHGRISFSPMWLRERDTAIAQATEQSLRLMHEGCRDVGKEVWRMLHARMRHIFTEFGMHREQHPAKPLRFRNGNGTGGGSVYLKQILEHRNNIRNGDGA